MLGHPKNDFIRSRDGLLFSRSNETKRDDFVGPNETTKFIHQERVILLSYRMLAPGAYTRRAYTASSLTTFTYILDQAC
jgi:hypothetical protein